jgi:hypothetical protein
MIKFHNNFNKTNKNNKNNKNTNEKKINLSQKYSLETIDEGVELGGFKHSNDIIGVLGLSLFIYYIYYT